MHHGMLTIYKEKGYTSSDAVARLRGILRMRKIGHTGTLDPDAEGVLPMCLGNATRICELIADREKEYLAVMRLGVRTDTQDMSGEILSEISQEKILEILLRQDTASARPGEQCRQGQIPAGQNPENPVAENLLLRDPFLQKEEETGKELPVEGDAQCRQGQVPAGQNPENPVAENLLLPEHFLTKEQSNKILGRILEASDAFTGEIEQIPPMYSAIKVNGKRLYDMARKGITVERKPRRITIHSLKIEKVELPFVTMRVRCSKGTYIRTLCEDLGNALGTGAAMQSLLRTRVGQFTLEEALKLDELERIAKTEPDSLPPLIRPVDSFFADLPAAECTDEALRLLKNGNSLTDEELRFLGKTEDPLGEACGGHRNTEDPLGEVCGGHRNTEEIETGGESFAAGDIFEAEDPLSGLPGIGPGDRVIRMYDPAGRFFGLYRTDPKGRKCYTAYKMFLPEM